MTDDKLIIMSFKEVSGLAHPRSPFPVPPGQAPIYQSFLAW